MHCSQVDNAEVEHLVRLISIPGAKPNGDRIGHLNAAST